MAEIYIHGVRINRFGRRTRKILKLASATIVVLAGVAIYLNISSPGQTLQPISKVQGQVISAATETFVSPYFQFQDSGKWVLEQNDSSTSKFVYVKYQGDQPQQLLYVFINQVPMPIDLATDYVLPVRIVNSNSFDATSVSGPCINAYGSQPQKVKEVTIGLATMLCDPSNAEYSVQLAQVGGDYQLDMRRRSGQHIQLIIVYKDVTGSNRPDSLLNIANSFKVI